MSYQEWATGAWVYDGPEPGTCDTCGTESDRIDEDGMCPVCLADFEEREKRRAQ